jgi:hypothetical protein
MAKLFVGPCNTDLLLAFVPEPISFVPAYEKLAEFD